MSPAQRHIESILFKECRQVINSGVNCKDIKIRNNQLFQGWVLVGEVIDSWFRAVTSEGHRKDYFGNSNETHEESTPSVHEELLPTSSIELPISPNISKHLSSAATPSTSGLSQSFSWLGIGFHLCLLNARSLVNKLSHLQSFVLPSYYSVYCFSEAWLSNFVFDNEIILSAYTIFRGGVLVAIKDSILCKQMSSHSGYNS